MQKRCSPLLGIDVWGELSLSAVVLLVISATEHAYYLKHTNKRAAYVANMLQIVNVRPRASPIF